MMFWLSLCIDRAVFCRAHQCTGSKILFANEPPIISHRTPDRLQAHADVKDPPEWSFDAPKSINAEAERFMGALPGVQNSSTGMAIGRRLFQP